MLEVVGTLQAEIRRLNEYLRTETSRPIIDDITKQIADHKKAIELVKNNVDLGSVSVRLSSSLGECVEGNDYEIVANKDGRFWINHKVVGSGEPIEQWIDGVLNVR